jgi:DNA-binding MarR family transcriptional regulator/N-acetylglutamate synthase-like GNAT family acetyltransferase
VLRDGLLGSPYSLTEARVIFELAQRRVTELTELRQTLQIDAGYLSRILAHFEADGIAVREPSGSDRRRQRVGLTGAGREAFRVLDRRSTAEIGALLARVGEDDQRRLVGHMEAIRAILEGRTTTAPKLRVPRPGELGWVVERHGALYAQEYGWNESFEALVARIVADYLDNRDSKRERVWIAELGGEPVGCVFCVRKEERVAQLRLLLVEPSARGIGIGTRLVHECIRFARRSGYERIVLWTNDVLIDARRIYERVGFELADQEEHRSFGRRLVGQHWSRSL